MIRVLFVCLGNICRSPMAEAVFNHKVRAAGLSSEIEADSAGTGAWHVGNPPHIGTARVLQEKEIPLNHRARLFEEADLNDFNYVIVMDDQNLRQVTMSPAGNATVNRLLDYAPHLGVREVPDPYINGKFDEVFSLVDESTQYLLDAIRAEHGI
jgi:protein-tyrosine phosphatase